MYQMVPLDELSPPFSEQHNREQILIGLEKFIQKEYVMVCCMSKLIAFIIVVTWFEFHSFV